MRLSGTDDPWLRYGATYWNHRAQENWDKSTHGAFGDEAAMAQAHRNLAQALHAVWGLLPTSNVAVLDVGCGFGASYQTLTKFFQPWTYVGVDCCTPYIAQAKKDFPNVKWFCEDVMLFDPPEKVDLVMTCATVTSLESVWPQLIKRAFERWLKPKGRFVVGEQNWFQVMEGPL